MYGCANVHACMRAYACVGEGEDGILFSQNHTDSAYTVKCFQTEQTVLTMNTYNYRQPFAGFLVKDHESTHHVLGKMF